MPGVERLDVVATENVLWVPLPSARLMIGCRESKKLDRRRRKRAGAEHSQTGAERPGPVGSCRNREEELVDIARGVKQQSATLSRMAVIFTIHFR